MGECKMCGKVIRDGKSPIWNWNGGACHLACVHEAAEKWIEVRDVVVNLRRGMAQSNQTKWLCLCGVFDMMEESDE